VNKTKAKKLNRIFREFNLNVTTEKPLGESQTIILLKNRDVPEEKIKQIIELIFRN